MRQTTFAKSGEIERTWRLVDAEGVPLGRLASQVSTYLMGKHRPDYTPHIDCGDYIIIINADKVVLTGKKAQHKMKARYSGYPGGLKMESYGSLRERRPHALVEDAVRRMLPKGILGRQMLKKLKVYSGTEHPHQAQSPVPMETVGAGQ